MTIHIELNPDTEAQLASGAYSQGIEVESYAQHLLQEALAAKSRPILRASQKEFREFLDLLSSKSLDVSHLRTETFSREMIYGEHD